MKKAPHLGLFLCAEESEPLKTIHLINSKASGGLIKYGAGLIEAIKDRLDGLFPDLRIYIADMFVANHALLINHISFRCAEHTEIQP